MFFFVVALRVAVVLLAAALSGAAQVQHQRTYTLSPSQDTFIHSERDLFYQVDYLQVGRRRDAVDSRTLLKFDLEEFRRKSSWGSEQQYADLKSSVISGASLRLSCIGVSDYLRSDVRSSLFNGTIYVSQILRLWDEEAATWTIRDAQGGVWSSRGLDTTGGDATTSFLQKHVFVDYATCQNGATLMFDISPATFESWLSEPASFYGILVWTNLPPGVKTTVKFASMENGHMDRHPALVVLLQDTIIDSGTTCSNEEFHCVDGRCINRSKVCNFANDCLHGNDEETCSIRCNFEDQCLWDAPPIMDGIPGWEVHSGSTGTSGTGPSGGQSDTGSDVSGSYLYVDASGKDEGALARFISPSYTESGPQCQLHFFYHMYGSDVGILRVVLAFRNQSLTVWEKIGSQLNQWLGAVISLGRLRDPFQIIFEAERCGGTAEDVGDIAIDSLELKDCSPDLPSEHCPAGYFRCDNAKCLHPNDVCNLQADCLFGEEEEAKHCGVVPFGGACSFEDGWCGWTNVLGEDHFDWTRHNGSTLTGSTGPSVDHTLGTDQGFYVYTEVSKIPKSSKAYLRSVWFPPPPPETYDAYSPHHHTCKVRFYYHMYGINIGQLKLYAIQNTSTESSNQLFSESAENRDMWQSYDASLPEITESYYLQFESTRGLSYRGDMALDDITLSRQCFQLDDLSPGTTTPELTTAVEMTGTRGARSTEAVSSPTTLTSSNAMEFHFGTCGSKGNTGPTQSMCNVAYRQQNFSVAVADGIQNWVVPATKAYSFKVRGAGGGTGVENTSPTRGAEMEASFNLEVGDQLVILVGQKGEDACDNGGVPNFGQGGFCNSQLSNEERNLFGEGGRLAGGGGGGGGGTFVAKLNVSSGEYILLVVAGGGGGLSFSPGLVPDDVHGTVGKPGPGVSGQQASTNDVSGAGGGWNSSGVNMTQVSGMSFLQGGQGGRQCPLAHIEADWRTQGGFGGGGGGCTNGGGGGGFTGGDAPLVKDLFGSGKGGTSYVHPTGFDVRGKSGANSGTGEVVITALVLCPAGTMLNQAKEACVAAPSKLAAVVGSIVPAVIIIVCIVLFIVLALNRRKKKMARESTQRIETADYQLNQLRHNASMDFNPCYQLGDGAVTIKDLTELPRENLKLIRALGQGAFGEVYHGNFQPVDEKEPLQVAVKTLPERCTQQDESDFLMEALIMGNFDHPNIVSLKGVCFTQAPRFILLEFMAGGELKQFLRDSRPRRGHPSPLDMSDLLLAALDVAKGCEYLEARRFIHRDVAARNVLLSSKEKGRTAKIGDFGMARDIYRADYYRKGGQAMLPVKWMPPEAFLDGIFTSKTDVWSYGVLLWEIMSLGYMPYPGMSNQEVIFFTTQGQRMNAPRNCPKPIQDLMGLCWQQSADDRPRFSTILQYLADFMKNPSIMNAPLPQELLDDGRPPSINRPRNSKTSPVLKVPGSCGQGFDAALGPSTADEGGVIAVEDDGESYLTPDWVPGGRMKEHLLMKDGNINNSAYCVNGAQGGVSGQKADRPGHDSINQLKDYREESIRHRDSDTSFDPPINQDEQANEFTDFLDKGDGDTDADETSSTPRSSSRPRVPPLDFTRLANGHLQDSSPRGFRKTESDEVDGQGFVKSSTPRNSSRSSSCDSRRAAKQSLPDATQPSVLEASQDECCSSRSEDQSTTQSARDPGPGGTQEQSSSSSFSPRILNRIRLPVFSRHISLEVPSSSSSSSLQPSGMSDNSLPMLNRMHSMPVSPNPYTMTELSSQGGQASVSPGTLDDSGISNGASRRVLFNSQSGQVVFDDDEPNGAVV